jgi:hypothetical protein
MTSALFIKTSSFGTSSDALKISVAARSLAMDDRSSSNDLVKQMGATCLMSAAAAVSLVRNRAASISKTRE